MSILCAFASYYTNLGSAEVDKINRDEHFHRAESLLNQASLIRRNGAPYTRPLPARRCASVVFCPWLTIKLATN